MANIFETKDPRGFKVVCSEEQWNDHILANHSDMEGLEQKVKEAIERPTMGIFEDARHSDRKIYYRKQPKKFYIKVVVAFEGDSGFVITAFPTDSGKSGEKLI
ncbi:MAG: hypothetical protein ABI835_06840 [Chloroflexota bacterium]